MMRAALCLFAVLSAMSISAPLVVAEELSPANDLLPLALSAFILLVLLGGLILSWLPNRQERRSLDAKVASRLDAISGADPSHNLKPRLRVAPSHSARTGMSIIVVFCLSAVLGAAIGLLQSEQYLMASFTLASGLCGLVAGVFMGARHDLF